MIHEYAIDPESVISWSTDRLACRYIKENFGIGTPRMMADFPNLKNWRKQFRKAIPLLDERSKSSLEELFKLLSERRVIRSEYEYDGKKLWLENAEKENTRHFFRAIMATANPNNSEHVLLSDQIGDWPNHLWDAPNSVAMERNLDSIKKLLCPLLQKSTEIRFVDPYFRATKKKFKEPFCALLKESVTCLAYPIKQRVELHVSADYYSAPTADLFEQECREELQLDIPQNLEIIFWRWNQRTGREKLHNRYILTELGGVTLGVGIDTGEKGENDDVNLIGRDQWQLRWNQYDSNSKEFELESTFIIRGTIT